MEGSGTGRKRPNILVTGTPGVGKTATAEALKERIGLRHISVADLVKIHKLYEGRDETLDTHILDEDALLDMMENMMEEYLSIENGVVVEYHAAELFPERWFDLVLVLRCRTDVLYDRLTQRQYSDTKRSENMECEIMQVILDEAREAYDPSIVQELPSNSLDDLESNIVRVATWVKQWIEDRAD